MVALIVIGSTIVYVLVAFDVARRLAWKRVAAARRTRELANETSYFQSHYDDLRFTAIMVSFILLPVAIAWLLSPTGDFDKPPRSVRREQNLKRREAEIERMEHELGITPTAPTAPPAREPMMQPPTAGLRSRESN